MERQALRLLAGSVYGTGRAERRVQGDRRAGRRQLHDLILGRRVDQDEERLSVGGHATRVVGDDGRGLRYAGGPNGRAVGLGHVEDLPNEDRAGDVVHAAGHDRELRVLLALLVELEDCRVLDREEVLRRRQECQAVVALLEEAGVVRVKEEDPVDLRAVGGIDVDGLSAAELRESDQRGPVVVQAGDLIEEDLADIQRIYGCAGLRVQLDDRRRRTAVVLVPDSHVQGSAEECDAVGVVVGSREVSQHVDRRGRGRAHDDYMVLGLAGSVDEYVKLVGVRVVRQAPRTVGHVGRHGGRRDLSGAVVSDVQGLAVERKALDARQRRVELANNLYLEARGVGLHDGPTLGHEELRLGGAVGSPTRALGDRTAGELPLHELPAGIDDDVVVEGQHRNQEVRAVVGDPSHIVEDEAVREPTQIEGRCDGPVRSSDLVELPLEVVVGNNPQEAVEEGHPLSPAAGSVHGPAGTERRDELVGGGIDLEDLVLRIAVHQHPEGLADGAADQGAALGRERQTPRADGRRDAKRPDADLARGAVDLRDVEHVLVKRQPLDVAGDGSAVEGDSLLALD